MMGDTSVITTTTTASTTSSGGPCISMTAFVDFYNWKWSNEEEEE